MQTKRKYKKRTRFWRWKTFQDRFQKQIPNAFSVLSHLHYLTLDGFLFDLDKKSNICRDIQKIEYGKATCTNSTKDIQGLTPPK